MSLTASSSPADALRLPSYENISLNPRTPKTPMSPTKLSIADDFTCHNGSPQSVSIGPPANGSTPQSDSLKSGTILHSHSSASPSNQNTVPLPSAFPRPQRGASSPSNLSTAQNGSANSRKYAIVDLSTAKRKPYKIKLQPPTRFSNTALSHPMNRLKRSGTESVLRGLRATNSSNIMHSLDDTDVMTKSARSSDAMDKQRERKHRRSVEKRRLRIQEEEYDYDADPSIVRIDTLYESTFISPLDEKDSLLVRKRNNQTLSIQQLLQLEQDTPSFSDNNGSSTLSTLEQSISRNSSEHSVSSEYQPTSPPKKLLPSLSDEPLDARQNKDGNSPKSSNTLTRSSTEKSSPEVAIHSTSAHQRRRPMLQKAHSMFSLSLHPSQKEHSEILKYQRLNRKFVFREYSGLNQQTDKKSVQTKRKEKLSSFLTEEIR